MISHYLLMASRNLWRNRSFSLINISGLALGLACSLLIWLWVNDERKVDAFHVNNDNLYTVVKRTYHDGIVDAGYSNPGMLAGELKSVFPEVQYATPGVWEELHTFEGNNKTLKESGTYASRDFFVMFSYPLLEGQPETALRDPVDIAISRKMAQAFFGGPAAAMGQTLTFDDKKDMTVSAVFENIGLNSSDRFDYVLSEETFWEQHGWARNWGNNAPATYLMLRPGTDVAAFEAKIESFIDGYSKEENVIKKLSLQKYSDVYLHSHFRNGELEGGRVQYVTLFTVVGVFVLLIACINFISVTTARSIKRAKEIGVRKVVGAVRSALIRQFIGETLLIVLFAFIVAIVLMIIALPSFNTLTQKQIVLPLGEVSSWIILTVIAVVTAFVSGSYPALYLSSFNPVRAFKGTLKFGTGALWFRKGLVVFQFALSMLLIIGTIVISQQVNYVQSVNLGYDKQNLVFVPMEGPLSEKYDVFKSQLLSSPGVALVSRMSSAPTTLYNSTSGIDWEGKDPTSTTEFIHAAVGYDFIKTMDIRMVQGRDFSPEFATDSAGYLLNETALKATGYTDPIGKSFTQWGRKGKIIGIMKDFHFRSLHIAIEPIVFRLEERPSTNWALLRTEPGKTKKAVANLANIYKDLSPEFPMTYSFFDQEYQKLYGSERIVETLSNVFAAMAILISCLGLLGLAIFTAEQRTREIGIRKILGASLTSLFGLLSKEIILLIIVSFVIASPLAWYFMDNWLQGYAYRVGISWWMFLVAIGLTLLVAIITISFQTIRTLLTNPVKTLKAD
jgi:putative ABC transport system permease protein